MGKDLWLLVQIMGFIISIWGVLAMKLGNFNIQPEVKSTAHFVTNGPYKYIRNPMYTGLIIFFGAAVISNYSPISLSVYTVLTIVLLEKIKLEEIFLDLKFGDIYQKYKDRTFRLVPYLY